MFEGLIKIGAILYLLLVLRPRLNDFLMVNWCKLLKEFTLHDVLFCYWKILEKIAVDPHDACEYIILSNGV